MGSFFKKIGSWIKSVFTSSSTVNVLKSASAIVTVLTAVSEQLVSALVDADAGDEAAAIGTEVATDLSTLASLIVAAQTSVAVSSDTKSKITTICDAITAKMSNLLSMSHIKNSGTVTTITAIATSISAGIKSILSLVG